MIHEWVNTISGVFGSANTKKNISVRAERNPQFHYKIDWDAFRLIVGEMYENRSERGGRPNIDELLMVKLLVLPQWHGLSDPELEKQGVV
jgi:hypothetical protein